MFSHKRPAEAPAATAGVAQPATKVAKVEPPAVLVMDYSSSKGRPPAEMITFATSSHSFRMPRERIFSASPVLRTLVESSEEKDCIALPLDKLGITADDALCVFNILFYRGTVNAKNLRQAMRTARKLDMRDILFAIGHYLDTVLPQAPNFALSNMIALGPEFLSPKWREYTTVSR